jgi:hypothetical protein
MAQAPWPVAIIHDEHVRCGAVLFRRSGGLFLTVVVKASFSFVPDGVVAEVAPAEIVRADRTFEDSPSRSVEAASDLAPYLPRCDVTFTGHAHAPEGHTTSAARVAIFRDKRALLNRSVHVFGDRDASGAIHPFTRMPIVFERAYGGRGVAANPVGTEAPNIVDPVDPRRPAAFGPIPRTWAARRRLLGGVDPAALEVPIADLPEETPWDYFQCAPAEQQIEPLAGGEWIVLDGLHPTMPRVATRLSGARAAARVRSAAPEVEVDLVADRLILDGDAQRCSIVWRGRHEVIGGDAALPGLVVMAGLELPDQPVAWADLVARGDPQPAPRATRPRTLMLDPARHMEVASRPVTPYDAAPRPAGASASLDRSATPWGGGVQPAPAPPVEGSEDTMILRPISPPARPPSEPAPPPMVLPREPEVVAPVAEPPAPEPVIADPPESEPESEPEEEEPMKLSPEAERAEALAVKLRASGAKSEDIDALMRVLHPGYE